MKDNSADDVLFEVADDDEPLVVKVPAGRSKVFRRYDPTQSFLLPPSLDDWLPQDHTARFISEVVDELLDLSVVYDSYVEASGAPPYDPTMMLKLLFYAYSIGVTSSREMERRCHLDVAFRWLSGNSAPDYRSISRFRRRHLEALDDLFTQMLVLCSEAGLVKLGRVALDGTKLRASASRHKAMSYDRLGPMIEATTDSLSDAGIEGAPKMILADAGYCSEQNLEQICDTEISALVATGRIRRNERVPDTPRGPIPKDATRRERLARALRTKPGRAGYARRRAIVEPAFGQMKVRQHAGHLRLRGIAGVKGEWTLHVICHNLRKLANAANAANGVPLAAS